MSINTLDQKELKARYNELENDSVYIECQKAFRNKTDHITGRTDVIERINKITDMNTGKEYFNIKKEN